MSLGIIFIIFKYKCKCNYNYKIIVYFNKNQLNVLVELMEIYTSIINGVCRKLLI